MEKNQVNSQELVIAAPLPAQQPESLIDSSIIGQELVWLNQLLGELAVLEVQGSTVLKIFWC